MVTGADATRKGNARSYLVVVMVTGADATRKGNARSYLIIIIIMYAFKCQFPGKTICSNVLRTMVKIQSSVTISD